MTLSMSEQSKVARQMREAEFQFGPYQPHRSPSSTADVIMRVGALLLQGLPWPVVSVLCFGFLALSRLWEIPSGLSKATSPSPPSPPPGSFGAGGHAATSALEQRSKSAGP